MTGNKIHRTLKPVFFLHIIEFLVVVNDLNLCAAVKEDVSLTVFDHGLLNKFRAVVLHQHGDLAFLRGDCNLYAAFYFINDLAANGNDYACRVLVDLCNGELYISAAAREVFERGVGENDVAHGRLHLEGRSGVRRGLHAVGRELGSHGIHISVFRYVSGNYELGVLVCALSRFFKIAVSHSDVRSVSGNGGRCCDLAAGRLRRSCRADTPFARSDGR